MKAKMIGTTFIVALVFSIGPAWTQNSRSEMVPPQAAPADRKITGTNEPTRGREMKPLDANVAEPSDRGIEIHPKINLGGATLNGRSSTVPPISPGGAATQR